MCVVGLWDVITVLIAVIQIVCFCLLVSIDIDIRCKEKTIHEVDFCMYTEQIIVIKIGSASVSHIISDFLINFFPTSKEKNHLTTYKFLHEKMSLVVVHFFQCKEKHDRRSYKIKSL